MGFQFRKVLRFVPVALVALLFTLSLSTTSRVPVAQAKSSTSASSLHRQSSADEREEKNKDVVLKVYQKILNGGKTGQVGSFFASDFIQHDPAVAAGQQGVISYVQKIKTQSPGAVFVIKHILADGDLVVVHSQLTSTPSDEMTGQAYFDLYRLSQGLIVEHWNAVQAVPATSANGHSMFSNLYQYQGNVPPVTGTQEAANKDFVIKAYNALITGTQIGVVDTYWAGANYLQHNSTLPDGADAIKQTFSTPGLNLSIRYAVAEGDMVFTYAQFITPGGSLQSDVNTVVLGDLFRVVNGKIVEHWDVVQPVPATSANGNSMFSDLYNAEH